MRGDINIMETNTCLNSGDLKNDYLNSFEQGIVERFEMENMDKFPRDLIEYVQAKEYRRFKKDYSYAKLTQEQLQIRIEELNNKVESGQVSPEIAECEILACLSQMKDDYVLEKNIEDDNYNFISLER